MPSLMHQSILGLCLLMLCVLTGCDKKGELDRAVRRAEKAEKTASSLRQVQNELIANKKDLELQILQLQQSDVADANDQLLHEVSQDVSHDTAGQEVEQLKQQLIQARLEMKEKDKDIQELQDLVEALTQTVNQLQGQNDEDTILDDEGMQDPNLLGIGTQG